jgi:hypothetical protein
MTKSERKFEALSDSGSIRNASAGSPSTTFKPVHDTNTNTDFVAPNPAPNSSAPAVPTCRVVNS